MRSTKSILIIPILFIFGITGGSSQSIKILPLGNSLTKGIYCTNGQVEGCISPSDGEVVGYRLALYNALVNAGYNIDFVGNEIAGYSVFSDYNHAGYPGFWSAQLATKMDDNGNYLMNSTTPDIVLLEIGTNDVYGGSTSIEGVRSVLNEIDEYETSSGKQVLVFLSRIIRFAQGSFNETLVSTFNDNLYNLYNTRKSAGDLIEWLDIGANLSNLREPSGDMVDELHPNQAGYNKMAQQWFNAIHAINTAPIIVQIPNQTIVQGNAFNIINLDSYIYDAEDADQYINWAVSSSQNFTIVIDGNRQATITPKNPDWKGSESITFMATDRGRIITALKKSASTSATFTVNALNHPPSITIPADRETYVQDYFELKLTAADVDAEDTPVLTATVLPDWLHFNTQTTTLYGTAGSQHVGNNSVKITVNDQHVSVDSNFVISVFPKSALTEEETDPVIIYPNPATRHITIICRENPKQPVVFRLYSVTGVLLFSEWIQGEKETLDLNQYNIPSGAYFYDISGYENAIKGKLLVNSR